MTTLAYVVIFGGLAAYVAHVCGLWRKLLIALPFLCMAYAIWTMIADSVR